jgi:MYXO-CTERM domain-containing protein
MGPLRRLAFAFPVAIFLEAIVTLPAAGQSQPALSAADFFVGVQASLGVNLNAHDAARFFNLAHAQCQQPVYVFVGLQASGKAKAAATLASVSDIGSIAIWLGTDCWSVLNQEISGLCQEFGHERLSTFLSQGSWTLTTNARSVSAYHGITATTDAGAPGADPGTAFVQPLTVVIDTDGDGVAELSFSSSLVIDLDPPPAPAGATLAPGNQAVLAKWNQVDPSTTTDLAGYQVLCSRADQYQVFKEAPTDGGGAAGQFSASFDTCPYAQTGAGVEALDPTFVCSPLLSPSTTSYRIEVLQNDITYAAAVVAVDKSGNPSPHPQVLYGTPARTASFDPGASSGFCSVSPAPLDWGSTAPALTALAALVAAAGLRRRRGRGRRTSL